MATCPPAPGHHDSVIPSLPGCRREAAASDEQQLRTPEDGRISHLTTQTLITRINSLLYIEENLPAMEKIVQARCAAATHCTLVLGARRGLGRHWVLEEKIGVLLRVKQIRQTHARTHTPVPMHAAPYVLFLLKVLRGIVSGSCGQSVQ